MMSPVHLDKNLVDRLFLLLLLLLLSSSTFGCILSIIVVVLRSVVVLHIINDVKYAKNLLADDESRAP